MFCMFRLFITQVIMGEYDVTVDEGTEQKTGVAKVVFHQSAETQTSGRSDPSAAARGGDLAMLKLEKAVTITKAVRTLPLPAPDEDFTGERKRIFSSTLHAFIIQRVFIIKFYFLKLGEGVLCFGSIR